MKKNMIIVGAGLAGLSAALQAVKEGCSVKLISSLPSERAQSVMAEGGINAALNTKGEDDSTQEHYEDTIKAGCNLADPNAVWNMTQAAPEVVKWLHSIGVQFNTCGYDELDLRNFGGQKKKRTAFAKSDTGKQIMTAMIDAVRRLEVQGQIERFEHHSFRTLLMTANICHGCVVCDNYTGEIKMLYADAVIVASGGMHGLFGNTTGSLANTGEVSASLFSAGVPMANLEMIQYHPTTVEIGGKKMLISEAARGEGGRLFTYRDANRWYFMEEKYPELGNLMPRDITAREIWKISKESPVYLDMTEIPKDVTDRKLAGWYRIVRFIFIRISEKSRYRLCRVSIILWVVFTWTRSIVHLSEIYMLPESAVHSIMEQIVLVVILCLEQSMVAELQHRLPARMQ